MSGAGRSPPRPALVGAIMLVLGAIGAAAIGRYTAADAAGSAPAVAVVAAHDVNFIDQPDGTLAVQLHGGPQLLVFTEQEAGFARGVLRGFARMRRVSGSGMDAPFRLARLADGRFLMQDPVAGTTVDLGVFGSDNAATMVRVWFAGDAVKASRGS